MRLGQAVCYGVEQAKEIAIMAAIVVAAMVIRLATRKEAAKEERGSHLPLW